MSEENTMKKWKEKSVCTLDFIEAISTFRLSDPAPLTPEIDDQRDREVRCRRRVKLG
jgi:hypothetical protein